MPYKKKKVNEPKDLELIRNKSYHKRIIKLYKDKIPVNRISTITGYTRGTIKRHLKTAGIYKPGKDNTANFKRKHILNMINILEDRKDTLKGIYNNNIYIIKKIYII